MYDGSQSTAIKANTSADQLAKMAANLEEQVSRINSATMRLARFADALLGSIPTAPERDPSGKVPPQGALNVTSEAALRVAAAIGGLESVITRFA